MPIFRSALYRQSTRNLFSGCIRYSRHKLAGKHTLNAHSLKLHAPVSKPFGAQCLPRAFQKGVHNNWRCTDLGWSDVYSLCAVRHLHQHADDRKFKYDSLSASSWRCKARLEGKGDMRILEAKPTADNLQKNTEIGGASQKQNVNLLTMFSSVSITYDGPSRTALTDVGKFTNRIETTGLDGVEHPELEQSRVHVRFTKQTIPISGTP